MQEVFVLEKRLKLKDIEVILKDMDIIQAVDYLDSIKEYYGSSLDRLNEKYKKKKHTCELELLKYKEMSVFEKQAYIQGYRFPAGIDEAGRGPLAGPVVAAAVILPEDEVIPGINDSKQLTSVKREYLFDIIKEKAIAWGVGIVDENCIDEINILKATRKAMMEAEEALKPRPDIVLIDAEKLTELKTDRKSVV